MRPRQIAEQIDIGVPVSTAYNQWTQFEDFPRFMHGVEEVQQLDDRTTHWRARIAGHIVEWTASIHFQEPDRVIMWKTIEGAPSTGRIEFEPLQPGHTRVRAVVQIEPETPLEQIGSVFGIPRRSIRRDLERFRDFIESRGRETGAWRGRIPPRQPDDIVEFELAPPAARGAVRPGYGEP